MAIIFTNDSMNPMVGEKLPVDIKEDDPRAVAVGKYGVAVDYVPRACLLTSSINKDS